MTRHLRSAAAAFALGLVLCVEARPQDEETAAASTATLPGDQVAPGSGSSAALGALQTNEPLTFMGTLTTSAGGALGWSLLPLLHGLAPSSRVAGLGMDNSLAFDASPDPSLRMHGAIDMTVPSLSLSLSELFLDYSLDNAVFLRAGEQLISWNGSRIFDVGDLMATSVMVPVATNDITGTTATSVVAVKCYVPFAADGITAIASTTGVSDITSADLSLAAKLDLAAGKFDLSAAAKRATDGDLEFAASAKTSVAGADLYAQAFGTWSGGGGLALSALENAYYEMTSPSLKFYAEHWYNGGTSYTGDHRLAVGVSWSPNLGIDLRLGVDWVHAFIDGSGIVMPVIAYKPHKDVTLTLGCEGSYGAVGSVYASQLPPGYSFPFSWDCKYALIAKADIALDY